MIANPEIAVLARDPLNPSRVVRWSVRAVRVLAKHEESTEPHALPLFPLEETTHFIDLSASDGPNHERVPYERVYRVGGPLVSEAPDRLTGHVLDFDGFDFADVNHGKLWLFATGRNTLTDVIGYPETLEIVEAGKPLPDGRGPLPVRCLYATFRLLREIHWQLICEGARPCPTPTPPT